MGSLEQLYQQVILDHAREKHGEGDPTGMDASSHQVNPTCGDEVTLGVTLDGQTLASVQWDGDGCSISRASLSMMTDLTQGKSAEEIGRLYRDMEVMMHSRNLGVDDEIIALRQGQVQTARGGGLVGLHGRHLAGRGGGLQGAGDLAQRVRIGLQPQELFGGVTAFGRVVGHAVLVQRGLDPRVGRGVRG